jgi:hypothetical protein
VQHRPLWREILPVFAALTEATNRLKQGAAGRLSISHDFA